MSITNLNRKFWDVSIGKSREWASSRYPAIPLELRNFLISFESAISKDEKSWFLSAKDFSADSDYAFSFDEFEKMSLEAAHSDKLWAKEIISFWNVHVPVYMAVGSGYEYIAYNIKTNEFVAGFGPEFEETTVVAVSIEELVEYVSSNHT